MTWGSMTSDTNFALAETSVKGFYKGNDDRLRISPDSINPALKLHDEAVLEIDPLPNDILGRIDLTYSFKPMEKDGELVIPIICLYHCEWEELATALEEKSDLWAGSEFGATSWISSIRLGAYTISCVESDLRTLQGVQGMTSTADLVAAVTGTRYPPSRANTLGRYIASLVSGGDNHISLLTAAYCALFDRLWCEALKGERIPSPAISAEHRVVADSGEWELLRQEFARPIVAVNDNPRYVKFWKTVCSDGTEFSSVVGTGKKKFVSPWASLGFKGLLKALIVSPANPDDSCDGDLDYLEMQEALDDYIAHHGLFSQAIAAARLASRLPWLVKYKFVDALPQPIHCIDLLRGLRTSHDSLAFEDITRIHPPRYVIGTLLIAGQLLDTRFNHWRTENTDIPLAQISAGAAGRKSYHRWELGNRTGKSSWATDNMKELDEIGRFLGRRLYSKRGLDIKFRNPGLNTSFWEAALLGPVPGTAAETVLSAQEPNTSTIGATVVSVSSLWFAKIRASDMFGSRIFRAPYNDFPFPNERVHSTFLNEIEKRIAYAQKPLPAFDLSKIYFGRNPPVPPFQHTMSSLAPEFPSIGGRGGIRRSGVFREQYLSRESINDILKFGAQANEGPPKLEERTQGIGSIDTTEERAVVTTSEHRETDAEAVQKFVADGWAPTESEVEGEVVPSPEGNMSAFEAFIGSMLVTGTKVPLDTVIQVAKEGGWKETEIADFHELGLLCQHFEVNMVLETRMFGCFRFPARAKRGLAQISLVYLEGKFGYLPQRCKEKGSSRRMVRFVDGDPY